MTEECPEGLGSTIKELSIDEASVVVSKTKLSMVVHDVEQNLNQLLLDDELQSVLLCGLEVILNSE